MNWLYFFIGMGFGFALELLILGILVAIARGTPNDN